MVLKILLIDSRQQGGHHAGGTIEGAVVAHEGSRQDRGLAERHDGVVLEQREGLV